jgi:hypothetical protein
MNSVDQYTPYTNSGRPSVSMMLAQGAQALTSRVRGRPTCVTRQKLQRLVQCITTGGRHNGVDCVFGHYE